MPLPTTTSWTMQSIRSLGPSSLSIIAVERKLPGRTVRKRYALIRCDGIARAQWHSRFFKLEPRALAATNVIIEEKVTRRAFAAH